MAIFFNRRPFIWRRGSAARSPRRVIVWVEELESRQVLAAVSTLSGNPLLLVQIPRVGPTNPALVSQGSGTNSGTSPNGTPTNVVNGTAPFVVVNGQSTTGPTQYSPANSPATPATLPQTPGLAAPVNLPPPPTPVPPLPPILQGVAVVPTSGPPTFADLQTLTANFIGGGHNEASPNPNVRPYNPPSTPRPLPSASPAPQAFFTPDLEAGLMEDVPPQATEAIVPLVAGFEEGPLLLGDQTEEVLQKTEGSVGLRVEACAAPVIAAALAAHWADQHRRPEEDEDNAEARKAGVPA